MVTIQNLKNMEYEMVLSVSVLDYFCSKNSFINLRKEVVLSNAIFLCTFDWNLPALNALRLFCDLDHHERVLY